MCKWGLISWPDEVETPDNLYLILGELYDKTIRNDIKMLTLFNRETKLLNSFKYNSKTKSVSNREDILHVQKKYKLTCQIKLIGETDTEILNMRRPVLYDISCLVPLFKGTEGEQLYRKRNENLLIVFPHKDPFKRGHLLRQCLLSGSKFFILLGDKQGENHEKTSSMMADFLSLYGVTSSQIIKIDYNHISQLLDILKIIDDEQFHKLTLCCYSEKIAELAKTIRFWRFKNFLTYTKKIYYICE